MLFADKEATLIITLHLLAISFTIRSFMLTSADNYDLCLYHKLFMLSLFIII